MRAETKYVIACTSKRLFAYVIATAADWRFLNDGICEVLEEKNYQAVHMAFPIMCGSIDRATAYTESRKMTIVPALYSLLMIRAVSVILKRGWTSKDLEEIGVDVCKFIKEVV